jgi:hypothetical protein
MPLSADPAIAGFLAFYPPGIVRQVQVLRKLVIRAVPTAVERLRPGWRLLGYDLPIAGRGTYFAWIWPQIEHVHVGWEYGTLMADPDGFLQGGDLNLKKVRYLTFEPAQRVEAKLVIDFTREAARIASMSRSERQFLAISGSTGDRARH